MEVLQDAGYEGCDYLNQIRGRPKVLYVCGKKVRGVMTPTFYHYDSSAFKNKPEVKAEANHIVGITYNSSRDVTMTFEKDPNPHKITHPSPWLRKWEGRGKVDTDKDCSLEKNNSTYKLKCGNTSGKKVEVQIGINI